MKIGAVVVTYNRLDKLKKALESFEKQLYLPAYVIVADNASTDGTAQYLRQWQKEDAGFEKIILTMESNMGGSAGSMDLPKRRRVSCIIYPPAAQITHKTHLFFWKER